MDDLKRDVKLIRESQIRMEENVKYHIKRTDLLEERIDELEEDVKPLYVIHFLKSNYRFIIFLLGLLGASVYFSLKAKGAI